MQVCKRVPDESAMHPVLFTVLDESVTNYFVLAPNRNLYLLPKADYIPVPKWKNVTHLIDVDPRVPNFDNWCSYSKEGTEYHLRRVGMRELHDLWVGHDDPCALILEQRVRGKEPS